MDHVENLLKFNAEHRDYERFLFLKSRARANRAVLAISLFMALTVLAMKITFGDYFFGLPNYLWYTIALGFLLIFLGWATYMYVQGGLLTAPVTYFSSARADTEGFDKKLEFIESRVESLSNELKSFDVGNRDALIAETVGLIEQSAKEKIWDSLVLSASKAGGQNRLLEPLKVEYEMSKQRLLSEVQALGKRGSVNLALGVVTTATALVILSSVALSTSNPAHLWSQSPSLQDQVVAMCLFFVPKISLAIFIQVFSLFFLKLYKAGLGEIKYFQNEITNLELKYFGLLAAVASDDATSTSSAVKTLIESERNHVLAQGQTTVELEKHKIEQVSSSEFLKLLPKIIGRRP